MADTFQKIGIDRHVAQRWNRLEEECRNLEFQWGTEKRAATDSMRRYYGIIREKFLIGHGLFFCIDLSEGGPHHIVDHMKQWQEIQAILTREFSKQVLDEICIEPLWNVSFEEEHSQAKALLDVLADRVFRFSREPGNGSDYSDSISRFRVAGDRLLCSHNIDGKWTEQPALTKLSDILRQVNNATGFDLTSEQFQLALSRVYSLFGGQPSASEGLIWGILNIWERMKGLSFAIGIIGWRGADLAETSMQDSISGRQILDCFYFGETRINTFWWFNEVTCRARCFDP